MEQIANLSTGNRRQGSNPCLSAQVKSQRTTLAFLRQSVSPSLLEGNDEGQKKAGPRLTDHIPQPPRSHHRDRSETPKASRSQ